MDHTLPIYIQIKETLRKGIQQGIYSPGERLPSENELAQQFSTTRATVVHAMQGLLADGLIERIRGKGTFVSRSPVVTIVNTQTLGFFEKDLVGKDKTIQYRIQEFGPISTSHILREKLHLTEQESIHRMLRVRLVDQQPIALEVRYMPSLIALRINMQQLELQAIQSIFQDQLGIEIYTISNQVRVALATKDSVQWLGIKRGRPIMIRQHSYLSAQNQPVLWGETLYREEYEIHYDSRRMLDVK